MCGRNKNHRIAALLLKLNCLTRPKYLDIPFLDAIAKISPFDRRSMSCFCAKGPVGNPAIQLRVTSAVQNQCRQQGPTPLTSLPTLCHGDSTPLCSRSPQYLNGKGHQGCVKTHPFTAILRYRMSKARTLTSSTCLSFLMPASRHPLSQTSVYLSIYVHSPLPQKPFSPSLHHPSSP